MPDKATRPSVTPSLQNGRVWLHDGDGRSVHFSPDDWVAIRVEIDALMYRRSALNVRQRPAHPV